MLAANIRDNYKTCLSGRSLGRTLGEALETMYQTTTGIERWVGRTTIAAWLAKHYHISYYEATDYYWCVIFPAFETSNSLTINEQSDQRICMLALWAFTEEVAE